MNKKCSFCEQVLPLTLFNRNINSKDSHQAYCKGCQSAHQKSYYCENKDQLNENRKNYHRDTQSHSRWKKKHPLTYEEGYKNYNKQRRLRVLKTVAGEKEIKCVRCGCDKTEILEINHINGGGAKEVQRKNQKFYASILNGERTTNDLELLCKVCNNLHYIELKYGHLPFVIKWRNNG